MAPPGDLNTLIASRHKARTAFEDSRGLPAGSEESVKQITHAEEVAKFLRENVVQGEATDSQDNYSTTCQIRLLKLIHMLMSAFQSFGYMNTPNVEIMRISKKERVNPP